MSFSGLLNSLWNSKSGGNKNEKIEKSPMRGTQGLRGTQSTQDIYSEANVNNSVPISQGKEYILYKQGKVNNVNNEINNFNGNGFQNYNSNSNSNSISTYTSNYNSNYTPNYGDIREGFSDMLGYKHKSNNGDLQRMEDKFSRSISSYATSQKNLLDKSQQFLQGKRTYGKNIHAIQAANTDDIKPNWVGCYKAGNDGLFEQADLGNTTLTDCKVRASDLGYSTFALRQKGLTPGNTCFVGDSIDKAQSSGLSTKSVVSYSFKKAEGTNTGGLMMNGQIGMYEDELTNNFVADLTPVANCDITIGGKINANTTVATYGYNCNGTAKSSLTAPPPQPAAAVTPTPDGYTKYSNKNSSGNDIFITTAGTSLADLAALCDKKANCAGFTNSGRVKAVIKPPTEWVSGNWNGAPLDLYVKNPIPPKPPTPPTPPVNCAQYGNKDRYLPDECYNQIWKSVCPAPMPSTAWWRTQTREEVAVNMYYVSTMPAPELRAMCYTIPPGVKTGATVNTVSSFSNDWTPINNGGWANSLSQLNDGTIICTNGNGNVFTRPNLSAAWTGLSIATLLKSVIQLQSGIYLGVGKDDNMLYITSKLTDAWSGYIPVATGGGKKNPVRYVKLSYPSNSGMCIQISQIAVYSNGVNVAVGKTVTAPNVYSQGYYAGQAIAKNAIDGTLSTKDYPNIYHSTCAVGDYWQLDLGQEFDVDKIVYYNRRDCCSERSNGMVVQIFDNNMKQNQFPVSNFTLNTDSVQTITLNNTQKPDSSTCCVNSITQISDGTIIGVGLDNNLWKRKTLNDKWTKISCPQSCCVTSISTLNDGSIVGVGTNGFIYTKKTLDVVWVLVDSSKVMSAVTQLKDGTIIGLDQGGSLFRK